MPMVHLRTESADADGSAASSAESHKISNNAHPGQVSFNGHSYKINTLAVEKV